MFADNFDNNDRGLWDVKNTEAYEGKIENGNLVIETKNEYSSRFSVKVGIEMPQNFTIEVRSIWKKGVSDKIFGVLFGQDWNNYYRFGVTADGGAIAGWFKEGQWAPDPIKGMYFKKRRPDGKTADILRIVSRQGMISYYVNDITIGTFKNVFSKKGWNVGCFVADRQTVAFDSIKVSEQR